MINMYEPFSYDNLPEKLVDNIVVLRQLPTETCEQRIQYTDLYWDCADELRELGYCFTDDRYAIITGIHKPYKLGKKQIDRVKKYYRSKCAICGFNITTFLVIHHIIPRAYGGDDNDTNLLSICPVCHKIMHMLVFNSEINNTVDRYIKKHKLADKLYHYTEHLQCDYFSDYGIEPDILAEWI